MTGKQWLARNLYEKSDMPDESAGLTTQDLDPPVQVLVVDDEEMIVTEIMEFLEDEGIAAISTTDPFKVAGKIAELPAGAVTVVLSDIRMPGKDGLELAAEVMAATPEVAAVEFVIMTGHGTVAMAVAALRARLFDFVNKPPRQAELLDAIHRAHDSALSRRRAARERLATIAQLDATTQAQSRLGEEMSAKLASNRTDVAAGMLQAINHELRNPLVPVIGLAEIIELNAGKLPEATLVEYARMIREAGGQMAIQIAALVDMAKITGDEVKPGQMVAAGELVTRLIETQAVEAHAHGVTIPTPERCSSTVVVDADYLMVLLNLLAGNAIRLVVQDTVLPIDAVERADMVAFQVTVIGPDYAPERRAEILRILQGGLTSLDPVIAPTGMALSMVRMGCGRANITLELRDEPARGIVAAILVPKAAAAA